MLFFCFCRPIKIGLEILHSSECSYKYLHALWPSKCVRRNDFFSQSKTFFRKKIFKALQCTVIKPCERDGLFPKLRRINFFFFFQLKHFYVNGPNIVTASFRRRGSKVTSGTRTSTRRATRPYQLGVARNGTRSARRIKVTTDQHPLNRTSCVTV